QEKNDVTSPKESFFQPAAPLPRKYHFAKTKNTFLYAKGGRQKRLPPSFYLNNAGSMGIFPRKYCRSRSVMGRNTRQGLPTATTLAGMSWVTTLPAPMTLFSPMLTPGSRMAPAPIHTRSPTRTGRLY